MKLLLFVCVLMVALLAPVSLATLAFVDEFDGPTLDPRWTVDSSPQNPAGSDLYFSGGFLRSDTTAQEAYHHLETTIDAPANFTVQAKVRTSRGSGDHGGSSLTVYWDPAHFISLNCAAYRPVRTNFYDGVAGGQVETLSTYVSNGWDFYNMVIEFTPTLLKFSFGNVDSGYVPVYHPELDRAREAWMTGSALMIFGKGNSDPLIGEGNPDFDNDAPNIYGEDHLIFDNASYVPEPTTLSLLGLAGLALWRRRRS